MNKKTILLDGAQGTLLWTLAEAHGAAKAPVWTYNLTHPEFVAEVCREYAAAGSEIICANTFGANRLAVEKEPGYDPAQVIRAGVTLAKEALAGTGARVALDIGPLPVMMEPFGDLEEEDAAEMFREMLSAGVEAGADDIFFETFLDLGMLRTAVETAMEFSLPVLCSMSFEKSGRTMFGNTVEDMIGELEPLGVASVGMNCSLGPDLALPVIREFAEHTSLPLFFKPNAGMPVTGPDGVSRYDCGPEEFARQAAAALETGRIGFLGGCCGTDAEYIRKLRELL